MNKAGDTGQPEQERSTASLVSGGQVRVDGRADPDADRRIADSIGLLLQVKNFSVLLGAGASFHLGAPRIRGLSQDETSTFLRASPTPATDAQLSLAAVLGGETVDLERLLSALSASIAYAQTVGCDPVPIRDSEAPLSDLESLRTSINQALVAACDLPKTQGGDPWRAHREFFRKIQRSRRSDLPRVNVFTTNYDLAIEHALDDAGLPYLDGFSGTVERTFRPETYDRDLYVLPEPAERRLVRVPGVLYLHKLHGSINWRARVSRSGRGTLGVVQVPMFTGTDDLALIYPTPQKEADVLGHPYADLLRLFSGALTTPDTALLVVGFGFADDHINRLIFQALASNPTLQLFVVEPYGVLDADEEAALSVTAQLSRVADARINVLTGDAACFDAFQEQLLPDPEPSEPDGQQDAVVRALQEVLLPEAPGAVEAD